MIVTSVLVAVCVIQCVYISRLKKENQEIRGLLFFYDRKETSVKDPWENY